MNPSASRAPSDAFEIDLTVAPVTVLRLKTVDVAHIERGAALAHRLGAADVPLRAGGHRSRRARRSERAGAAAARSRRPAARVPAGPGRRRQPATVGGVERGRRRHGGGAARRDGLARPRSGAARAAERARSGHEPADVPSPPQAPPQPAVSTVTVRQPVRSGQVIYARGADLVVLASVNSGAQVIADGHIHIYGPLRGRALAGAQGMVDARVFCDALEAELVAVAGRYLVADEIPVDYRGRRAQLYVEAATFVSCRSDPAPPTRATSRPPGDARRCAASVNRRDAPPTRYRLRRARFCSWRRP